jgi:hypothetical protein
MTATLEERIRAALTARADQITHEDLRPATPPSRLAPAEPGLRRRILAQWKPVLVAATAATCAVVVITWLPRDFGRSGNDGPAYAPSSSVVPSGTGPSRSPMSPNPVPTGAVPSGPQPVTSVAPPSGPDPQPTISPPLRNPDANPTGTAVHSSYPPPATGGGGSPAGPAGAPVTTAHSPPTQEPQSGPARPNVTPS